MVCARVEGISGDCLSPSVTGGLQRSFVEEANEGGAPSAEVMLEANEGVLFGGLICDEGLDGRRGEAIGVAEEAEVVRDESCRWGREL